VSSIDALRRLPRTTKADVAERMDDMICDRYEGRLFHCVTSGSTGTALRFKQDSSHFGWVEACQDRAHAWWGIDRADRRLILWGRPVAGGAKAQARAWMLSRLRNALSFNTFEELSDPFFARMVDALLRFRPKLVYGYASSIGALAEYMDRKGIVLPRAARPRLVEFTGDHMFAAEKETAERVFGASVASLYASSEAGSLSYTCPQGGLHISSDHLLVEFLREDGTPAGAGEQAEVVVTTLNNFAMPLIRYRVGDLGSFSERTCTCGVTLPLMNLEVGKVADRITTSSKSLVSSYSLDYINKHLLRTGVRGIRHFLVEQTATDDFVLHIVREEPFDPRCVEFFVAKMKEFLGESIRTEVRFTDAIPVSASGKRRWFKKSIGSAMASDSPN
jgi:phenylacetate-CoA ligase